MSTKKSDKVYFFQRMEEVRLFHRLTKIEFCEKLGIAAQTYNKYKNGTLPSLLFVELFTENYKINGHWFLTGEGTMFLDEESTDSGTADTNDAENLLLIRDLTAENMKLKRRLDELEESLAAIQAADNKPGDLPTGNIPATGAEVSQHWQEVLKETVQQERDRKKQSRKKQG